MSEHKPEHDNEPPSLPPVLSDTQAARVIVALAMFAQGKDLPEVAAALDVPKIYVRAVMRGEHPPSVHFAEQLAEAIGVDARTLIFGKEGAK